jgi:TonB family protein
MNYDRVDISSMLLSMAAHLLFVLLLSMIMIKAQSKPVALITDVTLIDIANRAGVTGEEKKTMGLEKKQIARTADSLKNKIAKKTKTLPKIADVKAMLKKIEEEKSKLDIGISRENLRQQAAEEPNAPQENADDVTEQNAVAGGEPTITGALAARKYKKAEWKFPKQLPEETELMVEITVLSSGIIKNVQLLRASGYPELDRMALSQARKLQFDPLTFSDEDQTGVLLFKFGAEK